MDKPRPVAAAIERRRSVRHFSGEAVDALVVRELIRLACHAPAPHHSRPWRFVDVRTGDGRAALAEAMAQSWRADLFNEDADTREVDALVSRSRTQIIEAPALVLACFTTIAGRDWPDSEKQSAERDMFVQSLGAALQNILLAAEEMGLAAYLKGAPLFCKPAVRKALALPDDWQPAFLVLIGHGQQGFEPPLREPVNLAEFLTER